nr:uncharacterized protein LOC108399786 isoform X5 [Manis javanica]XP_036865451.1 uncharacterized protein LOC108399786 isoform X5 [Manis javanica]
MGWLSGTSGSPQGARRGGRLSGQSCPVAEGGQEARGNTPEVHQEAQPDVRGLELCPPRVGRWQRRAGLHLQMPPARQGHPHLKQETGGAFSGDVCLRRASRREAGWSPGSAWTLHTDLPVLPATWKDSQELLPLRGQDAVSMMQRTGDHITTKIKELERVERGIRGHDGPGGRAKAPFQRPGPEYREAARTAGCGEVGGPCACLPEVIGSMQNAVLDQPRRWSGHGAGVGPAGADPSSSRWKASRYSLQWKNAAVRAQHAEV